MPYIGHNILSPPQYSLLVHHYLKSHIHKSNKIIILYRSKFLIFRLIIIIFFLLLLSISKGTGFLSGLLILLITSPLAFIKGFFDILEFFFNKVHNLFIIIHTVLIKQTSHHKEPKGIFYRGFRLNHDL